MTRIPAIIVDVDGTLARKHDKRGYFDWHLVGDDHYHEDICELTRMYHLNGYAVLVVSGRMEAARPYTEKWLTEKVPFSRLFLRANNDYRKDDIVKSEIYHENIKDEYDIRVVIDDRDSVVAMWRSLGLRCLQVARGDF